MMVLSSLVHLLLAASLGTAAAASHPRPKSTCTSTTEWETKYTSTAKEDVAANAAVAKTSNPTSAVEGAAFDRLVVIYFENENYDKAIGDRECQNNPFSDAV